TQALFDLVGNSGGDRSREDFSNVRKVLMMDRPICSPVFQLFQGLTTIFDDLAIDSFDLSVRSQDANEAGYPINDRAQTLLAFTKCLFGSLALGQIKDKRIAFEPRTRARSVVECGKAHQHRYAASVFTSIFLFEWLDSSGRIHLLHCQCIALAPRRQR